MVRHVGCGGLHLACWRTGRGKSIDVLFFFLAGHACMQLNLSPLRKYDIAADNMAAPMAAGMADADASMPRNAQLLAILRQRGVPVDGVLERQELVALVKRSGGIPASTSVPSVVAPVLPAPALAPLPPLAAKRTLADVDADARPEEARRARVRVSVPRGHLHPFAAGFVRVVRFEVAHAIVASVLGGGFTAEARYEDLELVNVPGVGEACASEASEMHARSTYKKGDLVCIVGGPHVRHTGTHVVTLVKGDDKYDVHVAEHGGLVVPGNFLVRSALSILLFPKLYVSAAAFSNWGSGRGSRDATNSSGLD